jgi:hypothetical protein
MTKKSAVVSIEPSQKRDRKMEAERAQLTFFSRVASLNDQRNAGQLKEVWQVAQALIICGMPYDEPKGTLWERSARLGDGSVLTVTFACAVKGVSLPYGQDRGPMYFMINKALANFHALDKSLPRDMDPAERTRRLDSARFVHWEVAAEYLKQMGKADGGRDYRDLAKRMERIRSCAISVVRNTSTGKESLVIPIVRSANLPLWAVRSSEKEEKVRQLGLMSADEVKPFGFEFSPDFFKDFVQHHVPVPAEVIKVLLRRPKHLDIFTFLCWRGFAARSTTFIPINDLRRQIGSTDGNARRLAAEIQEVINLSKQFGWRELNAEMTYDASGRRVLKIGKPLDNVHFLPPHDRTELGSG